MMMKVSKEKKEKEGCECEEAAFCPSQWIYTQCPFAVEEGKPFQKEGRSVQFYKILKCSCGKEFGEVQFSGYEPGKWRIFKNDLIAEKKLNHFKEYISNDFIKELQPLLERMAKIEKSMAFASKMYDKVV